jgi:hypothetical protein
LTGIEAILRAPDLLRGDGAGPQAGCYSDCYTMHDHLSPQTSDIPSANLRNRHRRPMRDVPVRGNSGKSYKDKKQNAKRSNNVARIHQAPHAEQSASE